MAGTNLRTGERAMTYRVINVATGEVVAVLGDLSIAMKFADRLAGESNFREQWAVTVTTTVYETPTERTDG
jgi:hypothetical protein